MMDHVTVGHVLMALAALALIVAILSGLKWARYRAELRGTPLYARKRDARRLTIAMAAAAIVLAVLGCLTPLCEMGIA
jgi:uncharacterized iron-regulated membrane protein